MFTKLRTQIIKVPRLLRGVMLAMMVLAIPAIAIAYGPERPTYDANKVCTSTDPSVHEFGACGETRGPVFNSFINAGGYGDERNFNTISKAVDNNPVDDIYQDDMKAEPGQEYWMRIYVHNNANQTLNCLPEHLTADKKDCTQFDANAPGIAQNTNVRIDFDKGRANGHDLKAYVKASNVYDAKYAEVYSDAQLKNNDTAFRLEYVPGSAKAITAKKNTSAQFQSISDDIASPAGTPIGQNADGTLDATGNFPGCFNYVTRIYVKVVVKAPVLKVVKRAYISGTGNMVDGQTVNPTDNITWKAYVFNIGNDDALDVTLRDGLPKDNKFLTGNLKVTNDTEKATVQDPANENAFFNAGGMNISDYHPMTAAGKATLSDTNPDHWAYSALVTYKTSIGTDNTVCQLANVVYLRAGGVTETNSTSVVNIDRNGEKPGNGCNVPPTPKEFKCEGLTVSLISDRNYRFTAQPKVVNVTIKDYLFDFGDSIKTTSTGATVEHAYAQSGTYKASVKIRTSAGTTKDVCEVEITVPAVPTTEYCVVPGKQNLPKNSPDCKEAGITTLPNTGAGTGVMAGLFLVTTVGGTMAHRMVLSRRFDA